MSLYLIQIHKVFECRFFSYRSVWLLCCKYICYIENVSYSRHIAFPSIIPKYLYAVVLLISHTLANSLTFKLPAL